MPRRTTHPSNRCISCDRTAKAFRELAWTDKGWICLSNEIECIHTTTRRFLALLQLGREIRGPESEIRATRR